MWGEMASAAEVEAKIFLLTILKMQLARKIGKNDDLARDLLFMKCVQELIDASVCDEKAQMEI